MVISRSDRLKTNCLTGLFLHCKRCYMKMSAHHCVEVAVDHDGVPSSQVDVLLPPITHLLTCTMTCLLVCQQLLKGFQGFIVHSCRRSLALFTYIICGPPGFEFEVFLEFGCRILLEVISNNLHLFILLIIQKRSN